MMTSLVLMLTFLSLNAFPLAQKISAHREAKKDYSFYESRILKQDKDLKDLKTTPLSIARIYSADWLPPVTAWKSKKVLQERFEEMRDEKFLILRGTAESPRRISWLYPHDGCFVRAALANRLAFRKFIPIPDKVFAFGNLLLKTPYASRGEVGWWFHVAPIVRVGKTKYVLDPSVELLRPLELKEWLARMGEPKKIKVSICRTGAFSPIDSCDRDTDGIELTAKKIQPHYLIQEEKELKRLGKEDLLKQERLVDDNNA